MRFRSKSLLTDSSSASARPETSNRSELMTGGAVLLVQTGERSLRPLEPLLQGLGHEVLHCSDMEQAVSWLRKGVPAMVVSDCKLELPDLLDSACPVEEEGDLFLYKPISQPGSRKTAISLFLDQLPSKGTGPDLSEVSEALGEDLSSSRSTGEARLARFEFSSEAVRHEIQSRNAELEAYSEEFRNLEQETEKKLNGGPPEEVLLPRIAREEMELRTPADSVPDVRLVGGKEPPAVYLAAVNYVLRTIWHVKGGGLPDLSDAVELTHRFLDHLDDGPGLLLAATDRHQPYSVSAHSVNAALLGLYLGRAYGLSVNDLRTLGAAGLLHEVGVVRLPEHLLHSDSRPGEEELELLRSRPTLTGELLSPLGNGGSRIAEAASQVYEREDGSGYPAGLTGARICEEGKVLGLADLIEACLHNRPHRRSLTGYRALRELTTRHAAQFSDKLLKLVFRNISFYPFNEYLRLSSGETGRVLTVNPSHPSKPRVEILLGSDGEKVRAPSIVDLSEKQTLKIERSLTTEEAEEMGFGLEGG